MASTTSPDRCRRPDGLTMASLNFAAAECSHREPPLPILTNLRRFQESAFSNLRDPTRLCRMVDNVATCFTKNCQTNPIRDRPMRLGTWDLLRGWRDSRPENSIRFFGITADSGQFFSLRLQAPRQAPARRCADSAVSAQGCALFSPQRSGNAHQPKVTAR
jgi:hypothetical protein